MTGAPRRAAGPSRDLLLVVGGLASLALHALVSIVLTARLPATAPPPPAAIGIEIDIVAEAAPKPDEPARKPEQEPQSAPLPEPPSAPPEPMRMAEPAPLPPEARTPPPAMERLLRPPPPQLQHSPVGAESRFGRAPDETPSAGDGSLARGAGATPPPAVAEAEAAPAPPPASRAMPPAPPTATASEERPLQPSPPPQPAPVAEAVPASDPTPAPPTPVPAPPPAPAPPAVPESSAAQRLSAPQSAQPPAPPTRRAPPREEPPPRRVEAPSLVDRQQPAMGGRRGGSDAVRQQSEGDFLLAQIMPHWLIDVRSPRFRGIQMGGTFQLNEDGMLGPPYGRNDPWRPELMIENYARLAGREQEALRTALETFLRAVRSAQPFRLPPTGGPYPRLVRITFAMGDL